MNTLRQVRVLSAAFCLVGIGLLAASAFLACRTSTFIHTSRTALGRVVELEGNRRGRYVTVFTFPDASGQIRTARTKSAQNPPTHPIGATVEVLFQPTNPEDARIRSFKTLWDIPTFLAGFGVLFAGVGGYAFVAGRKTYGELSRDQGA